MPMNGTIAKRMNEITNKGITNFLNVEVSMIDIKIITNRANKVKIKCFEKKK